MPLATTVIYPVSIPAKEVKSTSPNWAKVLDESTLTVERGDTVQLKDGYRLAVAIMNTTIGVVFKIEGGDRGVLDRALHTLTEAELDSFLIPASSVLKTNLERSITEYIFLHHLEPKVFTRSIADSNDTIEAVLQVTEIAGDCKGAIREYSKKMYIGTYAAAK